MLGTRCGQRTSLDKFSVENIFGCGLFLCLYRLFVQQAVLKPGLQMVYSGQEYQRH